MGSHGRIYFKSKDIVVIPPNNAPDKTSKKGIANADRTQYYTAPNTSTTVLGSWPKGTVLGYRYWDKNGEWLTATIGNKSVFFLRSDIEALPSNDNRDNKTYFAITLENKPYYTIPSTDSKVYGSWNAGTKIGYVRWDAQNKWLSASIGNKRVYFTPDSLDTLPRWDAPNRHVYKGVVLEDTYYYEYPSKFSKKLGKFSKKTNLSAVRYDRAGLWLTATIGNQRIYFPTETIALFASSNPDSTEVFRGYTTNRVDYYGTPDVSENIEGYFPSQKLIGYRKFDIFGHWYWAYMGDNNPIYFKPDFIETLPKKTHGDKRSYKAYSVGQTPYYSLPTTTSPVIGVFQNNAKFGFMHWSADGEWLWATIGKKPIYFRSNTVDAIVPADSQDKSLYKSYALRDTPYYYEARSKAKPMGTFKAHSTPSFYYLNQAKTWGKAKIGTRTVYFRVANLEIMPRKTSTDTRSYKGKTTAKVSYYAHPTTSSRSLGTWDANTRVGYYKWDSSGKWYTARIGSQQVYFRSSHIKRIIEPQDVIAVAKSQVGVRGGYKYLRAAYGPNVYYPWCATFQWWVFNKAGASSLFYGGKNSLSPAVILNYYRANNQIVSSPRPGDLAFFSISKNASHIALVVGVSGSKVQIIDGNYGGQVNQRWVRMGNSSSWGGTRIIALARPAYY